MTDLMTIPTQDHRQDHREAEELFDKIRDTTDLEERTTFVEELISTVRLHIHVEETSETLDELAATSPDDPMSELLLAVVEADVCRYAKRASADAARAS